MNVRWSVPGAFAEAVRGQFMDERIDYFKAVEAALYEASGFQVGPLSARLRSRARGIPKREGSGRVACASFALRQTMVVLAELPWGEGPLRSMRMRQLQKNR